MMTLTRVLRLQMRSTLFALMAAGAIATTNATAQEQPAVEVEEVTVETSTTESTASSVWKETKAKTGEAASNVAEFSKTQGGKLLEAGKTGVAKGAEVVSNESAKAWDATKKATGSAVKYTGEKAAKAGNIIKEVVVGSDSTAPVTDKSISE